MMFTLTAFFSLRLNG